MNNLSIKRLASFAAFLIFLQHPIKAYSDQHAATEPATPKVTTVHFQPLTLKGHIPMALSRKAGNSFPLPLPQSIDPVSLRHVTLDRPGTTFVPSPDGLKFAYQKQTSTNSAENRPGLWISDTAGQEEAQVSEGHGLFPAMWSDDSKYLLATVAAGDYSGCDDAEGPCVENKTLIPIMAPGVYSIDLSHGQTRLIDSVTQDYQEAWNEQQQQLQILGFIHGTHSFVYRDAAGSPGLMRYDIDSGKTSEYQTGFLSTDRHEGTLHFVTNRSPQVLEPKSMIVIAEVSVWDDVSGAPQPEKDYIARFNLGVQSAVNSDESILVEPVVDRTVFVAGEMFLSPNGKRLAYLTKFKTVPPGIGEYNLTIREMANGSIKNLGPCFMIRGWFGNDHIISVVKPKDFDYGKMYVTGGTLEEVSVLDGSSKILTDDESLVRYQSPIIF